MRTRMRLRASNVATINTDPHWLVWLHMLQQGGNPCFAQDIDIDVPIVQRLMQTGPLPYKKGG
ncbi:hypothetical protein KSZ_44820 [Dictyobacter formicarum]|uniref:Uncharacterized protein n=1 Tax=Dictyobacter formicarum TaxID=2778368 RepID=A0ABQ3VN03_9CHLR|nr:hypothetical protein KSZ_44820 [Dictyobacter formicarum]